MELWSYQRDGFNLISDKVDPSRSRYRKDYSKQYARLDAKLGTDQYIWCCTSSSDWVNKNGYEEWRLEVPVEDFLKVIDSVVWDGILGIESKHNRLEAKLESQFASSEEDPEIVERQVSEAIKRRRNPSNDPWSNLFILDSADDAAEVLLLCPIKSCWKISNTKY